MTIQEIVERALRYIADPDWEFKECLILKTASELAPKMQPTNKSGTGE